jgi:hypothetical protein
VSCVECGRRYPEHAPACSLSFTFPEPAAAALPDTVAAAVRLALSVLSGDAYGEPNTEQATADALSILTHYADQCSECAGAQHTAEGMICTRCGGAGWEARS